MALPEIVIASASQLDRLGDIPRGTPDTVYAEYMDRIALQAVEGGGLCDRKLFELAFFAQFVKPVAYRPTAVPKPNRPSFDLAERLDEAAGRALARVALNPRPVVDPTSFGILLGTGSEVTPTVFYEIEPIGTSEDSSGYRGTIGIDALWTPQDSSLEIDEDSVQTHTIFEIERLRGQVARAEIIACKSTYDMGLFVGTDVIRDNIDVTTADYDETTRRLYASLTELREAADRLELPIR